MKKLQELKPKPLQHHPAGIEPTAGLTLDACFRKFVEREEMNATEAICCKFCSAQAAPIKQIEIWSAPEVLIVHLKRFEFTERQSNFTGPGQGIAFLHRFGFVLVLN
jgi:ubiquitin C-terminal hydrolase